MHIAYCQMSSITAEILAEQIRSWPIFLKIAKQWSPLFASFRELGKWACDNTDATT